MEQYAEHSKDVWEGSKVCFPRRLLINASDPIKFWKKFFEASANVSLSSYEEPPAEDETATEENTQTTPSSIYSSSHPQDDTITPKNRPFQSTGNDSTLASTPSHITPRPLTAKAAPTIAPYSSPYESLKREVQGDDPDPHDEPSSLTLPSTPRAYHQSPDPQSSPFLPPSTSRHPSHRTPANDVLLHRILDKNWRLQATPHSEAQGPKALHHRGAGKAAETPLPSMRKRAKQRAKDPESLDSSPAVPAPELHAEIFGSPVRQRRVPGVSILTPARRRESAEGKSRNAFGGEEEVGAGRNKTDVWDSDSDDDVGLDGMSPPKTMQFHVPQTRLLRTPGKFFPKHFATTINFFIPPFHPQTYILIIPDVIWHPKFPCIHFQALSHD